MALWLKPSVTEPAEVWVDLFASRMPDLEVRVWPDIGNTADIEFALVRRPPAGALAECPNLRFVASIPAGVETLIDPEVVPAHLPIVRTMSPFRGAEMAEFAAMHALWFHRNMLEYQTMLAKGEWKKHPQPMTSERRVGIMGLGALGLAVAERMRDLGFATAGWVRKPRRVEGVEIFVGDDGFDAFLARTDILVCVLPMTDETAGIMNRSLFERLPKGAFMINMARGAHLVDEDLIAMIDEGHMAGAAIDVFHVEPPPADLPLVTHPRIITTPHVSTRSRAAHLIDGLMENMRRARAGEPLLLEVDRSAGY